jgi:hypothetical protein
VIPGVDAMPRPSKTDWKSLWGILWRVLLLGPIFGLLRLALLLLVIGAFAAPPLYAVFAFVSGNWFLGIVAVAAWAVVLRFRRPILHWALEGIEYASL